MRRMIGCAVLLVITAACGSKGDGGASSASAKSGASAAPAKSAKPASSAALAGSATAAPAAGGGVEALGGADWKAVFTGAPPVKLEVSLGGGRGDGMTDDYTRHSADPNRAKSPWVFNAAGGGGINWSPSKPT